MTKLGLRLLCERRVEVERSSGGGLGKTGKGKAEGHKRSAVQRIGRLGEWVRQRHATWLVLAVDLLLLFEVSAQSACHEVLEKISRQLAWDLRHVWKRGLDHVGRSFWRSELVVATISAFGG